MDGEKAGTPMTKPCPDCAEEVQAAARVCRHCRYRFDSGGERAAPGEPSWGASSAPGSTEKRTYFGFGWKAWAVIIAVVAVAWSAQTAAREEGQPSEREINESALLDAVTPVFQAKLSEANTAVGSERSRGLALDGSDVCVESLDDPGVVFSCAFREDYADAEDAIWTYEMVVDDGCFTGTLEGVPQVSVFTGPAEPEEKAPIVRELRGCL